MPYSGLSVYCFFHAQKGTLYTIYYITDARCKTYLTDPIYIQIRLTDLGTELICDSESAYSYSSLYNISLLSLKPMIGLI